MPLLWVRPRFCLAAPVTSGTEPVLSASGGRALDGEVQIAQQTDEAGEVGSSEVGNI